MNESQETQSKPEAGLPLGAAPGSASPVSVALLSLLTSASLMRLTIKERAPQLVKTTDWKRLEDAMRRAEFALQREIEAHTPNDKVSRPAAE